MKLLKLLIASTLMLVVFTSASYAEYSFQLVRPPGAVDANLFGINNAGKAVGNAFDEFSFTESYVYDMNRGTFESLPEFDSIDISNPGMIVGAAGPFYDTCAILDKQGNVTYFYPPSWTEFSYCTARGANPNGLVSGFTIGQFGGFTGFIYDSNHGTFEEFLHSPQTITHGINAQGQNVGSVVLFPDEAYPGSPVGVYGYLREPEGSFRYFEVAQNFPGTTRIRGISENGLIAGFYIHPLTLEFIGYATTLPGGDGFATISLADEEVLHRRPCDPEVPDAPPGYVMATDVFLSEIRNDGVVVGQCVDWHVNWDTGDWIFLGQWGLIGTPDK